MRLTDNDWKRLKGIIWRLEDKKKELPYRPQELDRYYSVNIDLTRKEIDLLLDILNEAAR